MDKLKNSLSKWNIELSDKQINQFNEYYNLLITWNEKMNLTSITEKDEVIYKHFVDSIVLAKYFDLSNSRLLDLGTGAGFPGIPLKIICPECKIVLLDSLNKRVNFLNEVIKTLELKDILAVHGRAEDLARDSKYREGFNIVTSRAVANLSTLSEYCLPFVKVNGFFVPYKSGNVDEELDNAKNAIKLLGGKVDRVEKFCPPDTDFDRSLIFINKIKKSDKKYPRKAGTPSKEPLM